MELSLLVFTQHDEIRTRFEQLSTNHNYHVTFENGLSRSLLKLLESKYQVFIVDADSDIPSYIDLIRIVQKIRPHVSIVVLLVSMDIEIIRVLSELGIYFYLVKPVHHTQIW